MTTNYHTPLSGADIPWTAVTFNTRFSSLDSAISDLGAAIIQQLDATAGEGLADRDAAYIDPADGKVYLMDNNAAPAKCGLIRGFVDGNTSMGATATLVISGLMDGFSSLTAPAPVYVDSGAGALTQTKPNPSSGGAQVAVIEMGVATSATMIFVRPKPIQFMLRDAMAQNDTLTLQHYPDDLGYARKLWANFVDNVAGSALETYASGNQDTQVALEDRSPATYGSDVFTGGTASASSSDGSFPPANAFDNNASTQWIANGVTVAWLKYDLGASNEKIGRKMQFTNNNTLANRGPKDFTIEASNNDSDWDVLATITGETGWSLGEVRSWTFSNSTAYRYWRINITAVDGGNRCACAELEVMEAATYNDGADKLAQSFTLASAEDIGSVDLYLRKLGAPSGTLTIRIETDSSGEPSGTLADAEATKTLAESSLGASFALITVSFDNTFNLSAGTYHIVLDTDRAASETDYVEWGADGSAPSYSGGEMLSFDGATWNTESKDAIFTVSGPGATHPQRVNVDHWASTHADMVNRYGDGAGANLDTKSHFKCTLAAGFADITLVVELA